MDKSTRQRAQRRRKARANGGAKDGDNDSTNNNSILRSPPQPRSRSLLQQQDKDQGDGTAVSESDSDDEADSDKELTSYTLLQALSAHVDDADAELKQEKVEGEALEAAIEFKERMLELKTKVQMIEDGKFAEYCRRCVDFKDERSRSLETAKQHKELQLKNVEDLRMCDLQTANNVYATAKAHLKQVLMAKVSSMLSAVDKQLETLDKADIEAPELAISADNTSREACVEEDLDHSADDAEPRGKKPKLAFDTLDMSGPFATKMKSRVLGCKDLPCKNMDPLPQADILDDLAAVCSDWKAAIPAQPTSPHHDDPFPLETVEIQLHGGVLECGKYMFDEGDEVVVSSNVMQREYIGVIQALSNDAVFLQLNTGETARVYYSLIASKRCELKPILRGNLGLKNFQSSGWVRCEPF
ncbi:hypothetical protein H310_10166 [Aphanomyces invadans]|uniref:Uncharacterized protein n=1 Tax=Aphanomyces invadans TaxID=157072 RepID=A0A024TRZ8_9STRA|nr:hypothetical protein H310_10166 [Aphanomyces invadans]ETV96890.1 hypothetical protein H310_10166 [Aphanomyces invadans]|eukprot:XP_008874667.1 hypothetical protein H310_10166 [Aphanomyces invadans]